MQAPLLIVIAFLGVAATENPPITSTSETFVSPLAESRMPNAAGIADERMYYYRYTGLLRWSRALPLPVNRRVSTGLDLLGTRQVITSYDSGMVGYYAGPSVHFIDLFGLSDSLLARLPAKPQSRIGHFEREMPAGYYESVKNGDNRLINVRIGALYRDLHTVTAGPIWTGNRWRVILRLNLRGTNPADPS
jgi:arabinofuranosyltransferase